MECAWNSALLDRAAELPSELLDIIPHGTHTAYLEALTSASLDARYTDLLFAHCQPIFAHICASLRQHGSLASSIATLSRIVPFASHLAPFATRLLALEGFRPEIAQSADEQCLYLLGFYRLLCHNFDAFSSHARPQQFESLLRSSDRAVAYLSIRILQLYLCASDAWLEQMIVKYLGGDDPDTAITGAWDDRRIDYRFLSLWEDQRRKNVTAALTETSKVPQVTGRNIRSIPIDAFSETTVLVGDCLLPYLSSVRSDNSTKDVFIETATNVSNLQRFGLALRSPKPVLLSGLAGSGKTHVARHVAGKVGKLADLVTLHLNEQSDAKLLVGIYSTGDSPGSFVWQPGVLTRAVQEGRWILIEDLDRAPNEIIGTLLPLFEQGVLAIPNRNQVVHAAPGFRIIATVRSTINTRGEETVPLSHMLGIRHWQRVHVGMPSIAEHESIARQIYPSVAGLLSDLVLVYKRLQDLGQQAVLSGQSKIGVLKAVTPRDLFKWCSRTSRLLRQKTPLTSHDMDDIFLEGVDCFVGALPQSLLRTHMTATIAEILRIDPQRRDHLLNSRDIHYESSKAGIVIGRYTLSRPAQVRRTTAHDTFSTNPHTCRMLERVAAAVLNREPLLLVGETGVGKTTAVQHLAHQLGKKIEPFNLSQQSEAGDLLGGFKPITPRTLMIPMNDEFRDLFEESFSMSKNKQFLGLLSSQMAKGNWKAVCKLWQQALKMVDQHRPGQSERDGEAPNKKRRTDTKKVMDLARWDAFTAKAADVDRRLTSGKDAFAFSFVEGNIVKALRNGDWVLLDEINLATPDTLEALADMIDPTSPSLLLTESGNIERVVAHPDFRVFAAMNPATDVGKKDLPPGVRSRFTELYVEGPDKDLKSLQSVVSSYLRGDAAADRSVALDVSTLYQAILMLAEQNRLVDGAGQKPHFSLRTLTRTLSYAKYIAPQCNIRRALYEGFQMSFLTYLDAQSCLLLQPLLLKHLFDSKTKIRAEVEKALRQPSDGQLYVQGFPGSKHWLRRGRLAPEDESHYILTPFIRSNLENLIRATSTRKFPILIQGPTSSGKTSMIEYLAKRTGHEFVRINNHEHTDLQEYLGTYVSGQDGRLSFQEGVLVRALREGHWLVLDELNLAPSDVLEALNRLLDDNRELLIPETQETIRPHENFVLFATQNPAGLYGGRKALSRAFRNRFLELHFDDIPIDELQEILHRRTQLPESRCRRIVAVYRELSVLRQETRVFEQKSFATLRDLFRWALRPNDTIEDLANNGFMLLAERVRSDAERHALKSIIEKTMSANGPRIRIDDDAIYAETSPEIGSYKHQAVNKIVVWTSAMRRLYILVARALRNNEPVLLVGETGCGKTTVCQMLADAMHQRLHIVNAHQNTETGDLIGSQRPIRNRSGIEEHLRKLLLSSPLLGELDTGGANSTEALLEAYDSAFATMPKSEQLAFSSNPTHVSVQNERTRFKALFEWSDGSMVQAMKEGSYFLLDEISLADDSVLERINSVLESHRSVLLAEKGVTDSFVTAAPGFQFLATMNPGGDYGKRELSPALRNRFTEIWVPALSDMNDVRLIVDAKLIPGAQHLSGGMVSFAQWFQSRYNTSANSSVSIRDILAWVQFINSFSENKHSMSFIHGAAMVYIDSLGANPAGLMALTGAAVNAERGQCLAELSSISDVDAISSYSSTADIYLATTSLSAGPFTLARNPSASDDNDFAFDAPTTRTNASRIVRAMQLTKPILLEGSPGVGKTALVTAIAKAVGMPLTRINLSEQTDLIDLFGSDAPVDGALAVNFAWRDAPFLRAMKGGEWVLLDEMNLASQSVLEGLNACLDHRGEVFIPELAQTFTKHPKFRLFATQNPHHQGGGRKGLPASFVNRFTVVYADPLRPVDLTLICRRSFPTADFSEIERAVDCVNTISNAVEQSPGFASRGGPWEFNLRDLMRWLTLTTSKGAFLNSGSARDFATLLFTLRFRSSADRSLVEDLLTSFLRDTPSASDLFHSLSTLHFQCGIATLARHPDCAPRRPSHLRHDFHLHPQIVQSLSLCIQHAWPVILVGSSGCGKTALIQHLACTVGANIVTISLNAESDAPELIGGYEQHDPSRTLGRVISEVQQILRQRIKVALLQASRDQDLHHLASLEAGLAGPSLSIEEQRNRILRLSQHESPEIRRLVESVASASDMNRAQFEWVDGVLIDALQQGKWLILDNANLCSPSVLDRLNSLLEHGGSLLINEHVEQDGSPRLITPHPDFRVFLTVDPRFGELSRAMRNRAVELFITDDHHSFAVNSTSAESAMTRFSDLRELPGFEDSPAIRDLVVRIAHDHLSLKDQYLQARFEEQVKAGLFGDQSALRMARPQGSASFEDQGKLQKFYEVALIRRNMSADFALAQTLHPFNNQPLLEHKTEITSQASILACACDVAEEAQDITELLASAQSDRSWSLRMRKAESVLFGQTKRPQPQSLPALVTAVSASVDFLTSAQKQLISFSSSPSESAVKHLASQLRALWQSVLSEVGTSSFDATKYFVLMSTVYDILDDIASSDVGALGPGLRKVLESANGFAMRNDGSGRGHVPLWNLLRSRKTLSESNIKALSSLQAMFARFDDTCNALTAPLGEVASLRLALARAMSLETVEAHDLDRLTQRLEGQFSSAERAETTSSTVGEAYFRATFESISQRSGVTLLAGEQIEPVSIVCSEILAGRTTAHSICAHIDRLQDPVTPLRLLSKVLRADTAHDNKVQLGEITPSLIRQALGATHIGIGALPLYQVEVQILGAILGKHSTAFCAPQIEALDNALHRMVSDILRSASEATSDQALASIASTLLTRLHNGNLEGPTSPLDALEKTLASQVHPVRAVVDYLTHPRSQDESNRRSDAAQAWSSFALGCLFLYIKEQPFDPALKPLLDVQMHQRVKINLVDKHIALTSFRRAVFGHAESLRSRLLAADIDALGPEPAPVRIERPEVSQLGPLYVDLHGLLRVLQSGVHDADMRRTLLQDAVFLSNLSQIRSRLEERYAPYADIVTPVIGFIDCLRVAAALESQAVALSDETPALDSLLSATPLMEGSVMTWISESTFTGLLTLDRSIEETLYILQLMAIRGRVQPLEQSSLITKQAIQRQFERFYESWNLTLGQDQRAASAKSSLYRYQGEQIDADEASAEDLSELFPTTDAMTTNEISTDSAPVKKIQDFARRIATVHHALVCELDLKESIIPEVLADFRALPVVQAQTVTPNARSWVPTSILAVDALSQSLGRDASDNRLYNIYTDSNVSESKAFYDVLQASVQHFQSVHDVWPEHATPIEVMRHCEQTLAISHCTPLTKLLPNAEKLHATITEWQKVSSKEYSAAENLESVTNLIIRWRQLELSSWAGLLERELKACEEDARSWWFVAYENLIAAPASISPDDREGAHVFLTGLFTTLESFLATCGLGEFSSRLSMLRDFTEHISTLIEASPLMVTLEHTLRNFVRYYEVFLPSVEDRLSKGRATLEKDVKNVIQVASWKDRNIEVLKQSVAKSHRKLLRVVRKYRILLAQPAASIIRAEVPDLQVVQNDGVGESQVSFLAGHDLHDERITQSNTWTNRAQRFRNQQATVQLMDKLAERATRRIRGPERLDSFLVELKTDMAELSKATPQLFTEENKHTIQHLKTRKRRLLADVLRDVRSMGFQIGLSDHVVARQNSLPAVLIQVPSAGHCNAGFEAADRALFKLLSVMPGAREGARKPSDDLTPAETARCLTLLESMLHQSISQRGSVCKHANDSSALRKACQQLADFADATDSTFSPQRAAETSSRSTILKYLLLIMPACTAIVKAQSAMSGISDAAVTDELSEILNGLQKLQFEQPSTDLPVDIVDGESAVFARNLDNLTSRIRSLVQSAANTSSPFQPVLCQLTRWVEPSRDGTSDETLDLVSATLSEDWVQRLLALLDGLLAGVQRVENMALPVKNDKAWLLTEEQVIEGQLRDMDLARVAVGLTGIMSDVESLGVKIGEGLSPFAAVIRSVRPIIAAYCGVVDRLTERLFALHTSTLKAAATLATIFTQLTANGFCTPPEKAPTDDKSKGNVESGTGLGEGEGAEDISKDVGDDEDLSDLAQQADQENKDGEMEDSKDAVDMADEELEGATNDDGGPGEVDEGEGDDSKDDDQEDIEEEAGKVDDLGASTVDEKMWDSGQDKEEEQTDREADNVEGTKDKSELEAAESQAQQQEASKEDAEDASEMEVPDDESEAVQKGETEKLDAHTKDEDNLDLPDDIDIDKKDGSDDDMPDLGQMSDAGGDDEEPFGRPDNDEDVDAANDDEEPGDPLESEEQDDDMNEESKAAGDDASEGDDDDQGSDILMKDNNPEEQKAADEAPVYGEQGSGEDPESAANADATQTKPDAPQPEEQEGTVEQQQSAAGEDGEQREGEEQVKQTASQNDARPVQPSLPYKQIGDMLEEWYKQQKEIEDAKESGESEQVPRPPPDLTNSRFEHVGADDAADTQALGAASADQSTAMDEDKAISVNEEEREPLPPLEEVKEQAQQTDEFPAEDAMDAKQEREPQQDPAKAFVGQSRENDLDQDMTDGAEAEDDHMDNVDEQLVNTHISETQDSEQMSFDEARALWSQHEHNTQTLALMLTEHLRLILQPTQATKMRGDFRTGKRLNIKRIIPYIASSYKRDKIWMRRSVPSKRAYQIMLAIDDSQSMAEGDGSLLAFDTAALISKALTMLEVGELSVVGFGEHVNVAHEFSMPFTSDSGPALRRAFTFAQTKTNVRSLIAESLELFRAARLKAAGSASDLWQLQLIISDGVCEDHAAIRQLVRQAREERIMIVFVIVDAPAVAKTQPGQPDSAPKQSILDLQTAEFVKNREGEMELKMLKYLDTFPFEHYLIVREVQELPTVLAGALRQWFAEVVDTGY